MPFRLTYNHVGFNHSSTIIAYARQAMTDNDDHIEGTHASLGPAQRAWRGLMILVIIASAGSLGMFLSAEMNPDSGPVIRMDLADLTPQPGFDI